VADARTRHVRAVQLDYDARAPRWNHVYDGTSFHDVVLQRRLAIAASMLAHRPRTTVGPALDVGCGAGQLLAVLASEGEPVAGCDISGAQLISARARLAGGDAIVVQADALQLPFPDESFATVTALGLLEYLPVPADGITELARVTARGGHVVVSSPNPLRLAYLLDPVGAILGRLGHSRPGYRRQYTSARALRAQLAAAGLTVMELTGHGIGRFTLAGRPVLGDAASVRVSRFVESKIPDYLLRVFGSNLVAIVRRDT
jgi:SAM-dependent methyltransferase